jgi:aminopeptidase N
VGHLGRLAAALALIGLVVVPALAASVPPAASRLPDSVAPPAAASPTIASSPAPSLMPGSTNPPRRAPVSVMDDAGARGIITGAKPGLVGGTVNATSMKLTAEYDVQLALNFGSRAFNATTTIHVRNDSGAPIDRLELNTIAARLGSMKLGAVTSAGKAVTASVDDQTILVPLGGILGAGRSVDVTVAYSATLRSSLTGSNWLFTRTNGIVDAHRWIPWISRNVPFDRPNHGDPFVTGVSPRVRVTITSDRPLGYASTGEPIAKNGLATTFEATNVRDFAFTAAPDYKSTSSTVGDVTVRVYYRPGFPASSVLAAAKHAISSMEPLVGQYPYAVYDLAQTAGGYGMESPGLTWIPTGVASSNLSYLVHHETGHQWFYGVVGSDQAMEPFADEAMTDFLARYVLGQKRSSRCSTARLDLSIYRYSTACYYEIVYIQGGNFIDDLRRTMGSTAFWNGVRAYMTENRFGIAPTKRLLETLDNHTSKDLVPRYKPRFPSLY